MMFSPISTAFRGPNVPRGYQMTPKGIVRVVSRGIKMDAGSHHKATRRRARKLLGK